MFKKLVCIFTAVYSVAISSTYLLNVFKIETLNYRNIEKLDSLRAHTHIHTDTKTHTHTQAHTHAHTHLHAHPHAHAHTPNQVTGIKSW